MGLDHRDNWLVGWLVVVEVYNLLNIQQQRLGKFTRIIDIHSGSGAVKNTYVNPSDT